MKRELKYAIAVIAIALVLALTACDNGQRITQQAENAALPTLADTLVGLE